MYIYIYRYTSLHISGLDGPFCVTHKDVSVGSQIGWMALFTKGRGRERMEQKLKGERVEIGGGLVGLCVGWGGVGNKADPKLQTPLGGPTQKCTLLGLT